jgi:hypothetical protein
MFNIHHRRLLFIHLVTLLLQDLIGIGVTMVLIKIMDMMMMRMTVNPMNIIDHVGLMDLVIQMVLEVLVDLAAPVAQVDPMVQVVLHLHLRLHLHFFNQEGRLRLITLILMKCHRLVSLGIGRS